MSEERTLESQLEEAKFYLLNQNYSEAERLLQQLVKEHPQCAEGHYLLGLVYELQNQMDQAKECYEKALALKPDYREAQEHLDKIVEIF